MYQPFMSNIYNHNRYILDVRLNKDEYWDFHVSVNGDSLGSHSEGLVEKCLISYIDITKYNNRIHIGILIIFKVRPSL